MILSLAKKYKNIVVLSTGIANECEEFARFFPDRYFSFGRAETNIAGAAAGFAIGGKLPVILCDASFLGKAYDVLKNCVCEPNLNVKLLLVGKVDAGLLGSLPNMKMFENAERCFDGYGPGVLSI